MLNGSVDDALMVKPFSVPSKVSFSFLPFIFPPCQPRAKKKKRIAKFFSFGIRLKLRDNFAAENDALLFVKTTA